MTRTELVEQTLLRALEGENADGLITSLKPEEQELFFQLVEIFRNEGDPALIDELWRVDYRRRPPTIEEFINDEYWLGAVLKPTEINPGIFPIWRDDLVNDFDLDSRIHNLVITGSLGIGKSWVGCAVFLYRVAMATLMRNPQNFLGLSAGSGIVYVILSVTKSQVQQTVFGDAQNYMSKSAYFVEECHFNPGRKYANFEIPLGSNILLTAGSKSQHIIGRNAMGVFMDEGNWRIEGNPDEKAYQLYDEIRTRIKNRFQRLAGFLPAISIIASSARDESSFTESVIKDIDRINDTRLEKVYRYSAYQMRSSEEWRKRGAPEELIKRHCSVYKPRQFKVAYGLRNVDPVILTGWYDRLANPVGTDPHEAVPKGAASVLVPEDFIDAFLRNVVTALQSVCGISTGGRHLLFPSTVDVERCIEASERDHVTNPSRVELIPISQEDDKEVWDYLDHQKFLTLRQSLVIPRRHPEAKRFGHVDLATTSMAGLAVCHLVGNQRVDGLVKDGIIYSDYRLIVEYDFILTITAGRTKPISLEKIQKFFFWLRQECGYNFGLVTADSYQSVMPLQMMETRGFETKVLSLDRNKGPYYAWRDGFQEHRIRLYRQRQMMFEVERLRDLPDKIDHPPESDGGSKDTTDAAAGAYFNAVTYEQEFGSPSGMEPSLHQPALDTGYDPPPPVTVSLPPAERRSQVFQA